ncbi:anhydro-N-acetylmuramic acid kinase [Methylobacter tundripaludum]|uniref:Anhydro-N-acetylmuramic acid kinase n=1 Tax=Methylobacter tundripaludum TaxID=173365 RepID=A0A2S6GJX7_9GAMM|nr:anhydro-N-acetylmuramic acid kinase [Methylobacter tundripaludum]PPK65515.1 anhydro-N-acetylmuramic acid kinase [Methylobacter tundripaludum]
MPELYIGLMSGTSLDGIDAALVDFQDNETHLVEFEYLPYSDEIQSTIQKISKPESLISLKEYGAMDAQLGRLFAKAVNALLAKAAIPTSSVKAIGSHGQTIYHAPDIRFPFSLQIGDPNIIAETTGITTVADFRRRDIAAKGQGAPLVPAFHQAVFQHPNEHRCIVNIGGIANITVLPRNQSAEVIGFDTGPGNTLMDLWIKLHRNLPYDKNGAWGKTGKIDHDLVTLLKQDAYFNAAPPKSTGKEYFSLPWIYQYFDAFSYKAEDVQASLCFLTAITICDAVKKHAPATERILICGGGIHNDYLLELIQQNIDCPVESAERYGIHPDHVEAVAFAWLARQTMNNLPGNLKEVTGALDSVILGGIYQVNKKGGSPVAR